MPYAHLRFIFRRDGVASHEQGSGGVPAGADPGSIGWDRPAGSIIDCTDTGDTYKFDGTNWDQDLNVNSTFQDAADSLDGATVTFTAPAANNTTAVHAGFAGNDVSNDFPGPFSNPDMPRRLQFVFAVGWDGGDINPTGTDANDGAATETITSPGAGGGTVVSVKAYKTVTSATKGAAGANPATCSIGTWHGFGTTVMPAKPGTLAVKATVGSAEAADEAATWDMTNGVITPTTLPDGARVFVAQYAKTGATSIVTATP